MQYVMYFRSVDDVMFARNGPYDAWLIERILKVTHQERVMTSTVGLLISVNESVYVSVDKSRVNSHA